MFKRRIFIRTLLLLNVGVIFLAKGKNFTPNAGTLSHLNNSLNTAATSKLTTPTVELQSTSLKTILGGQERYTATGNIKPTQSVGSGGETVSSTANVTIAGKQTDRQGTSGLPYWLYVVIGAAVLVVIAVVLGVLYNRFIKWKDHGSYMVWDETDLETSPAFTRESEFLLDNLTADQQFATPELQLYEIPLDSISHQHMYVGAKRVAPKRQSHDDKWKERTPRDAKKKEHFNVPSLTKFTKRDPVYNSVTDTCMTSVTSEGTLNGDMTLSRHTLTLLSNGGLDKCNGSTTFPHFDSISPKGTLRDKFYSMGNRTRSSSNFIQSRPLPAAPISKRFSKSLDRLRLFHTLPEIKPKGRLKRPLPDLPVQHPPLVKSASFGCNVNRIINNNCAVPVGPPILGHRKMSLEVQMKSPPEGIRKSLLSSHRFSKSLDTLLLLRGIDWTPIDIDIYHSYESVHGSKSVDVEYASVSDSPPNSPVPSESNSSNSSKNPLQLNSSATLCDQEQDNVYASVTEDEMQEELAIEGKENTLDQGETPTERTLPPHSDTSDKTLTLSSVSSIVTSPYACIRISQIPGLSSSLDHSHDKENIYNNTENSGSSLGTPENSGSTSGMGELKPQTNSARSSTHTYLELFPDEANRDSIISETSSGYARPVDIMPEIAQRKGTDSDSKESRLSLTDIKIPIETRIPFEDDESKTYDNSGGYDNPVRVTDDEGKDDAEFNITHQDHPMNVLTNSERIYENSQVGQNLGKCAKKTERTYENSEVALEAYKPDERNADSFHVKVHAPLKISEDRDNESVA